MCLAACHLALECSGMSLPALGHPHLGGIGKVPPLSLAMFPLSCQSCLFYQLCSVSVRLLPHPQDPCRGSDVEFCAEEGTWKRLSFLVGGCPILVPWASSPGRERGLWFELCLFIGCLTPPPSPVASRVPLSLAHCTSGKYS